MSVYKNKVIASKPYIARGNDTSEDKKLCSNCLKKGCNIIVPTGTEGARFGQGHEREVM